MLLLLLKFQQKVKENINDLSKVIDKFKVEYNSRLDLNINENLGLRVD